MKAACFAAFSFALGKTETTAAPTNGKNINKVNQFIMKPPPK
jgi:hypothetical protein